MPIYRLRPSFALGSNEDAYVQARSPRAAVVYWYGDDGQNRVSRFPVARGYRVAVLADPIDGMSRWYVRATRVRATPEHRSWVEKG